MKKLGPENRPVSCEITSLPPSHCWTILESISEGLFTIDIHKRITYFNRAAQSITGFRAREAIGQKCFDIFRANICETECPLNEMLAGGNPQLNLSVSIIGKSGNRKPVSISISALKDQNGEIIGAIESFRDLSELDQLRRQLDRSFTHEDIIVGHPKMREILSFLPDIAESDSAVLIEGPTGSGKELIARAVHSLSPRKEGPFVAVNCAALPDTLLESELFGYARGAFTGAMRKKAGRFLLANKGTLFLDEVCNTSMAFQADLLRVLEDGEFTPLGETKAIRTDFRVVAATNVGLKELVKEEKFREDLYYRLNVVKISLPPLRERREDIPLLIDHFVRRYNLIKGKAIQGVTPEVLSFLMDYPFPGNIRELENIIEYAFVYCKCQMIGIEHLPGDLLGHLDDNGNIHHDGDFLIHNGEAEKIHTILNQHKWNRQEAARALGMSRSTLWRKMKKYGLMK